MVRYAAQNFLMSAMHAIEVSDSQNGGFALRTELSGPFLSGTDLYERH
jgi:hypothetical protein